jgi:FkbH-like protein
MLSHIAATVYTPGFNQFRQEILEPASDLYAFAPDVVIVGFNLEDVFPDAVSRFATLAPGERDALRREILDLCRSLSTQFRESAAPQAQLLLQTLVPPFGAYDPLVRGRQAIHAFVRDVNAELEACVATLDYARLVQECGARTWTDPRTYFTARIPVAQRHWLDVARCYATYIRAARGAEVKCLVLDLDDTLWGGVLGEDGFDGIRIGDTYPGVVFKRFQEYLLALHADGYILAISSKNDVEDVTHVLRHHPGMVLREHHFAAIEAHWDEKADAIREISRQIHITPDHMLLVDDNPVEIAKVRAAVPGISCLRLQSPPADFPRQFDAQRCFGRLRVTGDDRTRGRRYADDRQRRALRHGVSSIGEFYRTLDQRLDVYVNHAPHAPRIAQLTHRTNQFNLTTRCLTESEATALMARPDVVLLTADLRDRFGESGTIAFVQIRHVADTWVFENWLMSCRVLGRTVEESLLEAIAARARSAGVETLVGLYAPTKKNAPFADFYVRNGFVDAGPSADGHRQFRLGLSDWRPRESFVAIGEGNVQAA